MSKNKLLSRRRTLLLSLGILAATLGCSGKNKVFGQMSDDSNDLQDYLQRSFTVTGKGSLKKRATAKGLIYGAESAYEALSTDKEFAAAIRRECNMLMNAGLKWYIGSKPLRPSPENFDFSAGDWIADFTKKYNLLLRGHTLVYHINLPPWFEETVNQHNAMQFLTKHVDTVAGHFAGRMHSWDVVNEAVEPGSGRDDGLQKTCWLEMLGPDYIEIAFRTAANADPKAMLAYNENALEYDTPYQDSKRTATLKLLERLKSRGTPVHALGIQAHMGAHEKNFNPKKFRAFLQDVADLGLKIMITEMDVGDAELPKDINIRDRAVAATYEDFLSVVLDERAVIEIITFGLSDRYTWLSDFAPRKDGLPLRPLPLDNQMKRKLAWNAIARAFDKAPRR